MNENAQRENVAEVESVLKKTYRRLFGRRSLPHGNRRNPLDELLFIICSNQTPAHQFLSTYRSLRRRFPRVDQLSNAEPKEIEQAIESGGRQETKSEFIYEILQKLNSDSDSEFGPEFGPPATLAPLRAKKTQECEKALRSLPGVGPKTARCVMMYSLGRDVFPVDTHCWRICCRLGWATEKKKGEGPSDREMDELQDRIPEKFRFSLHVAMVSLGREFCTAGREPKCGECPIRTLCPKKGVVAVGMNASATRDGV
jgi:endonuclease III